VKPYSLANQFLTIFPWPIPPEEPDPSDLSAAVSQFSFVGLTLGVILILLDIFLGLLFPDPVRNVLIVISLLFLTGGIHVKAIVDWAGNELPDEGRWSALFLAPVLGRAAMAYLIASLPREAITEGSCAPFAQVLSPDEAYVAVGWAMGFSLVLGFFGGVIVALMVGAATWGIKHFLLAKGNGASGDACLAAGEMIETLAFVLFSAWWGS
jgi:cobalamin synthase